MLLFIILVTFFEGERNAIKCTSLFPAGQTPLTALFAAGSWSRQWGAFPTADFGVSRGVGALPPLATVGIHLPLNVGAGVGSDPQEQTDTTAVACLCHSRVLEEGLSHTKLSSC